MYKALISFVGIINATIGETLEIKDETVAKDLLKAGYIEEIKKPLKEVLPKVEKKETQEN